MLDLPHIQSVAFHAFGGKIGNPLYISRLACCVSVDPRAYGPDEPDTGVREGGYPPDQ